MSLLNKKNHTQVHYLQYLLSAVLVEVHSVHTLNVGHTTHLAWSLLQAGVMMLMIWME